jgi:HTH-type transcriptional regulator/antitoxin HigA
MARIEILVAKVTRSGTPESDELELLTTLAKGYEAANFVVDLPSPVEAIKFRMEQMSLAPRDLIPYLGSRSRVSEVLSGKRSLTLPMIRALNSGLGIPAESLLRDSSTSQLDLAFERFPVAEMIRRGWLNASAVGKDLGRTLERYLNPLGNAVPEVLYRQTNTVRSVRSMDPYALLAWTARIANVAKAVPQKEKYSKAALTSDFLAQLVKLSWSERGPLIATEFLAKHGISVVVEQHLPKTHLDGATFLVAADHPVIGLTLRHDRIDNFWFTLIHELAHLILHIGKGDRNQFFDDLDASPNQDELETEADRFALDTLIPPIEWKASPASRTIVPSAAIQLAKKMNIHPAIVAGRMRREHNAYRLLNNLVGHGEVRKLFGMGEIDE